MCSMRPRDCYGFDMYSVHDSDIEDIANDEMYTKTMVGKDVV